MGFISDILSVPEIRKELKQSMATVAELNASVDTLSQEVVRVKAVVDDLKAHQGGIKPEELDPAVASISAAVEVLKSV